MIPPPYNPFSRTEQGRIARVWDVASRTQLAEFPRCSLRFSPDGKVLAALRDDQVIDLWLAARKAVVSHFHLVCGAMAGGCMRGMVDVEAFVAAPAKLPSARMDSVN